MGGDQQEREGARLFRAQFGEDRLLRSFFRDKQKGFFLEVGAYNGVDLSNSYYFEQVGWRGILVEPDPVMAEACRRNRPNSIVIQCAAVGPGSPSRIPFEITPDARDHSSLRLDARHRGRLRWLTGLTRIDSTYVEGRTLDSILEEHTVTSIDFVTIDVEGHEWEVMRGFDLARWKPVLVILERNQPLPVHRVVRHMHRNAYRYLMTTGVNDWYLRLDRETSWGHLKYIAWLALGLYGACCVRAARAALRSSFDDVRSLLGKRPT